MLKYLLLLVICGFNLQVFAQADQTAMKKISIGLNAAGDVIIAKSATASKRKKLPVKIEGMTVSTSRDREPVYGVPIGKTDKALSIQVSGTKENAKGDLGMTGDGFVVRVPEIDLIFGKILNIILQTDGNKLVFSSNKIEASPSFSFAFDPPDASQPSYVFTLRRTKLLAKKRITISLDAKSGVISFADNDSKGSYSLEITKINADGNENVFRTAEITSKAANRFQVDFKNWDGICLRIDDDGKGFADEKCDPLK